MRPKRPLSRLFTLFGNGTKNFDLSGVCQGKDLLQRSGYAYLCQVSSTSAHMTKPSFIAAALIISVFLVPLPSFSIASSGTVSATSVPIWAFNGAFANYTLTEKAANATVDSGWQSYTINEVNLTAATFLMTVDFFDQAQASVNGGFFTNSGVFPLNQSLAFPALNPSQLDMLNQGVLPQTSKNSSVVTATMVSVKAGTFPADQVSVSGGISFIWVDSYSGVVLKSGVTIPRSLNANVTQNPMIQSELTSTNVPMSETLPFNIAWIVISLVALAFAIVGLLLAVVRRSRMRIARGDSPSPPHSGPESMFHQQCLKSVPEP